MIVISGEVYYSQKEFDAERIALAQEYNRSSRMSQTIIELVRVIKQKNEELNQKNKEIEKLEFFTEALTKGLSVAGDTIREMRNGSIRKNG